MANLTNANLLDENVGINLKNERLQKTAQIALNPEMERPQPQQVQVQQPVQQTVNVPKNDEPIPNNLPAKDYGKKESSKSSDDNKIMGMKPALFYTLLGAVVLVGGYFAYKKFGKKLKIGNSSGGSESKNLLNKDIPIT
jgi:hypothetical protein